MNKQETPKLKNMGNYYGATPDRPFHLSVGVVVLDSENKVICLRYPKLNELQDVYALPNKTVRPLETLEATVLRCLKNELSCEATLITYLGTTSTQDTWWGELNTPVTIQKSVIFFLAKLTLSNETWAEEENKAEGRVIEHIAIDLLIKKMNECLYPTGAKDWSQGEILVTAKQWISTHPELLSCTL